ncbi:MAG: DNA recombination protein RmuC [Lachnospiraceae bacterium]|nr:DNA recombination protein RmuC [Lachnospiraceae bacterium]
MDTLIMILLIVVVVLELAKYFTKPNYDEITDPLIEEIEDIKAQNAKNLLQIDNLSKQLENARSGTDTLINTKFTEEHDYLSNLKHDMFKENTEHNEKMNRTLKESIQEMQHSNERKLTEIQDNVNEKLDKSLNERLDVSFRQIGEQLAGLNKSIGELQSLSSGVMDLQKTLSNVKTRGVFGEIQLANILSSTMDPSQYEENVATKKDSNERVEFAIKIPDKEDKGDYVYLPIDSKFPADVYTRIVDASNVGDADGVKNASKELETRIKQEAKTISEKYIDAPRTTDFAIMFLPTEGLYSEVLRIPGLTEWCQNEAKIIISGPTTITALLNSLSIGFKYLAVNKNSKEILKTLSAVKTQYDKFGVLISKTQKKLSEAQKYTDDMQHRSQMIQRRLTKIDSVSEEESIKTLNIIVDEDDE